MSKRKTKTQLVSDTDSGTANAPDEATIALRDLASALHVGRNYYIRTVRNDYVGRVVTTPGPYTVVLEDAAWVSESGLLTNFIRNGRADNMEIEIVGYVAVQWLEFMPWRHSLFTERV